MRRFLALTHCLLGLTLLLMVAGCPRDTGKGDNGKPPGTPPDTVDEHPEEGPHHGMLIELGKDHKYHAEVVHDEKAHKLTVYILGAVEKGKVETAVPIEAKEVVINLKHGDKAEQFKLKAVPDKGDPEGKSSRFVSEEKELSEDLDAKGANPQLVVIIAGKSYSGKIEHDHDHDHKHDHK